jgi:hypothetical protein
MFAFLEFFRGNVIRVHRCSSVVKTGLRLLVPVGGEDTPATRALEGEPEAANACRPPLRDTAGRLRGGWWGDAPDEPLVSFAPLRLARTLAPPVIYLSRSRLDSLAEFGGGQPQGLGQLGDVFDARIAQAAPDALVQVGARPAFSASFS